MIKSFADKRTEQIFRGEKVRRLDSKLQTRVLRRLRYINAAEKIEDLRVPPSNRLEKKKGDLEGSYSIRVNKQWRIVFRWVDNAAHEVRLIDYH